MATTMTSIRQVLAMYGERVKRLSEDKTRLTAENKQLAQQAKNAEEMQSLAEQELTDFKEQQQAEINATEAELQSLLSQVEEPTEA
jgi:transcription elongation GreA/GreB family factor